MTQVRVLSKLDETAYMKVLMRGINTSRKSMFMTFLTKNKKSAIDIATFKRNIKEINISKGAIDQDPQIFSLLLEQIKISGTPQWLYLLFAKDTTEQYHYLYVCCNYMSGVTTRICPTLNGKDLRVYWKENFDHLFHKYYISDLQTEQQSETDRKIYEHWIETADDAIEEGKYNKKYEYTKDIKDKNVVYSTVARSKNANEFTNTVLRQPSDEDILNEHASAPLVDQNGQEIKMSEEPVQTEVKQDVQAVVPVVPEKSWMTLSEERVAIAATDVALKVQSMIESELTSIRDEITKEYTKTISEAMIEASYKTPQEATQAKEIKTLQEEIALRRVEMEEAEANVKSLKASMQKATDTILEQKKMIADLKEQLELIKMELEETKKEEEPEPVSTEITESTVQPTGAYSAVIFLETMNDRDYYLFITRKTATGKPTAKLQVYNKEKGVFGVATSSSNDVKNLKIKYGQKFKSMLEYKDAIQKYYSDLEWAGMETFMKRYTKDDEE